VRLDLYRPAPEYLAVPGLRDGGEGLSYEDGWCDLPFVVQHRGPPRPGPNGFRIGEGPFGYPLGARGQNRPSVIVNHIMSGHKRTLDNFDWRYEAWVGVTFGLDDLGVSQYCSLWDAHWGNGIAGSVPLFNRNNPRLRKMETRGIWIPRPLYSRNAHSLDGGGVNIINATSVAKEHAGFSGNAWGARMWEYSIEIDRWSIEACRRKGYELGVVDPSMLAGHMEIDAVNRSMCPGTAWSRTREYAGIVAGGGGAEMFIAWPKSAKWGNVADGWVGKVYQPGAYGMNVRADLGLPENARMVRLLSEIDTPRADARLVYGHGGGKGTDDILSAVNRISSPELLISPEGFVDFAITGGPITFRRVLSSGFWTW